MMLINVFLSVYVGLILQCAQAYVIEEFEIRMPNTHPEKPDVYLSTIRELPDGSDRFIVAFEPLASMEFVHHMMIQGCKYAEKLNSARLGGCSSDRKLLYVWARNAPSLHLPKNVGFKVGKNADILYISLDVHYANVSKLRDGAGDISGVKLYMTSEPLPKRAGVALLETDGYIKGGTTEHFEVACPVTSETEMHAFAFRTHTHERGLMVAGYRVRTGIDDDHAQKWDLIGKKSPLLPQFFYPLENDTMIIKQGDILAARCTMKNNENRTIYIGSTSKDEMCNFYIMFYIEDKQLEFEGCFSNGPPQYYWASDTSLNNIPSDASNL